MAITPAVVQTLSKKGFTVFIEENAGAEAKFRNDDYEAAGGKITNNQNVFSSGKINTI